MDRKLLEKAFILGFAISREGYNGECCYDHLAPDHVGPQDEELADFESDLEKQSEFVNLRKIALDHFLEGGSI